MIAFLKKIGIGEIEYSKMKYTLFNFLFLICCSVQLFSNPVTVSWEEIHYGVELCSKRPLFLQETKQMMPGLKDSVMGQDYYVVILSLFVQNQFFFGAKNIGNIKFTYKPENCGWIDSIDIDRKWQNKGLGSLLMSAALMQMQRDRVSKVESYILHSNKKSIAFHKKFGFETKQDLKKDFYDCGFTYFKYFDHF
jgi:RimJ/RimL family protein N-acetyltransferase